MGLPARRFGCTAWTKPNGERARYGHKNRGLAYWTDGKNDSRIILISPGFQLVELNAKTGVPITSFGKSGIVELTEGLDRDVVKPGQIGIQLSGHYHSRCGCGRRGSPSGGHRPRLQDQRARLSNT